MILGLYIGRRWKDSPVFAIASNSNNDKEKQWNDGLGITTDKLRYYVTSNDNDNDNDDERTPIIATVIDTNYNSNNKKWYH